MPKILIVSNDSFTLWQFRRELISTMDANAMEVTVAVPFGAHIDDLRELGCELAEIPADVIRKGFRLMKFCGELLKKVQPDVVVTYGATVNIWASLACRKAKIPYCANVQSLETLFSDPVRSFVNTALCRIALKKARTVFFENPASADLFAEKKITPKAKQTLLPGAGVNLQHYALQPYPHNDPIRFLYVGRMMAEKGTEELLDAIKMLYDDCFEVRLDLVGTYDDAYAEQMAVLQEMGIVVHHGYQEDPRPYYAAADCIVMPSHREGMSNVLLEAAATGRPVIASYIPGCREAVDEGRTGFTFRSQDKYCLYEDIRHMATLTWEQRQEMGLAGRRRMEELFDKQMVVEDTLNAILRQ